MKRILLLLILLPFISNAQSFERGDFILSAGIDLGIYNTEGFDPVAEIKNTDNAVSRIIPIGFEYGLTNNIGIGLQAGLNKYASDKDSTSASNTDISLLLNYHFLRTSFFNMQLGIKYGLSKFNYKNKIDLGEFNATGGHIQAVAGANFFPGEHIGFNAHAAYNSLTYKNGEVEDNSGNKSDYELLLQGANIGVALMIRF
jgi:hypothetical protein